MFDDREYVLLQNPDFYDAILGLSSSGAVIYSYERMVESLMEEDEMTCEDAMEFIDYNTLPTISYMRTEFGSLAPVILMDDGIDPEFEDFISDLKSGKKTLE